MRHGSGLRGAARAPSPPAAHLEPDGGCLPQVPKRRTVTVRSLPGDAALLPLFRAALVEIDENGPPTRRAASSGTSGMRDPLEAEFPDHGGAQSSFRFCQ